MADTERTLTREIRGVSLFERRVGAGPAVAVLHGGPGAHHDYLLPGFDALADAGGGRTLVYYDQRGGGRSPVPREVPVGWREQVADLEALREAWGLERLTLAGYSWGGLLAMLYATEHPDRVERLALTSPAPAWRAAREAFEAEFARRNLDPALQAERKALRESGLRDTDPDAYQRRVFELSVVPYFHDPAKVGGLTAFRVTGRTQQEVWSSLGEYDLRPALAALRGRFPALVVHGASDPIPVASARETAEALGAEFHELPRSGHVPHVEARDEFRRIVCGFLAQ
jgi:proline iminopeptidase